MLRTRALQKMWGGLLLTVMAVSPMALAQSAEGRFYRAYYLEHARGDIAAASQDYDAVAADRQADAKLRAEARARGEACREELASADFAKLMPANALAYVELNRPGGQLTRLLQMLGLMREDGSLTVDPERRLAISPALVRELLGIRGVAVAVTGFDPAQQMPMGVAILHPGDIEVIRGAIETALPVAAEIDEPIEGFPTYLVEGQAYVTLTKRLVIVSQQRSEIEGVVWRLKGEESESLADSSALSEVMGQRDESLLFFCVNFKPMMPLINAAMAAAGTQSQEAAIAQALLDLNSLRTLVGRMGVSDAGLYLDVTLRLDEGHRNLAFHFLRMPAINRATLERVPAGAAVFFAAALNEAGVYQPSGQSATTEPPPVTMLDIGREVFANMVSVAVFAVPTDEPVAAEGPPIPPVAAVITVNDPVKSQALWNQVLGVASLASGAGTLEGMSVEIEGVEAQRYVFPEGVSVYLASDGDEVFISPSKAAIGRSLATRRGGESILRDPAFAKSLAALGPDATFALFAHPGRCAELAKPFMCPEEVQEIEPVVGMLTDTVVSLVMEHSNNMFRFSTMVTGLPDVGPFVSKMIAAEHQRAEAPGVADHVWREFCKHAEHDRDAALALGEKLVEVLHDDARELNNCAWALLTDDPFKGHFSELALKLSQRSNELTDHNHWAFVDTLALALFETGDAKAAVDMEKKALALCGDDSGRAGLEAALKRFEAALQR
jgi:hypothetical protein